MALVTLNFGSLYLNGNTAVSLILPDAPYDQEPKDFYQSGRRYPVLWLLHGTYGDHTDWLRKTNIELYASEMNLIVVMPSAQNSDYANWDTFMVGYSMFDYLTEELMPLVYSWFPASDRREDNFIAGLSMGGGGAVKYAVHHPEKFAAAASLSSTPKNLRRIYQAPLSSLEPRLENRARKYGSVEEYLDSDENTWDYLAGIAGQEGLPRLYFTTGTEDIYYNSYLEFKRYAEKIGLQATFEEVAGYGHEWRFWDLTIQRALAFFGFAEGDSGLPG